MYICTYVKGREKGKGKKGKGSEAFFGLHTFKSHASHPL